MIIIVQIIALLFTLAFALHDAQAVDAFRQNGMYYAEDDEVFHASGFFVRFTAALGLALTIYYFEGMTAALLTGIAITAIMWAGFDIALNLFRQNGKFAWHYTGKGKFFDELLSGKTKAALCAAAVIIVNLIYFLCV